MHTLKRKDPEKLKERERYANTNHKKAWVAIYYYVKVGFKEYYHREGGTFCKD